MIDYAQYDDDMIDGELDRLRDNIDVLNFWKAELATKFAFLINSHNKEIAKSSREIAALEAERKRRASQQNRTK